MHERSGEQSDPEADRRVPVGEDPGHARRRRDRHSLAQGQRDPRTQRHVPGFRNPRQRLDGARTRRPPHRDAGGWPSGAILFKEDHQCFIDGQRPQDDLSNLRSARRHDGFAALLRRGCGVHHAVGCGRSGALPGGRRPRPGREEHGRVEGQDHPHSVRLAIARYVAGCAGRLRRRDESRISHQRHFHHRG